jgi:hypothetical protein
MAALRSRTGAPRYQPFAGLGLKLDGKVKPSLAGMAQQAGPEGRLQNEPEASSRPSAVLRRANLSGRNAPVPAVDGQSVNSQSCAHSGHSGAGEISTPTTGLKVLQPLRASRRCAKQSLRREFRSTPMRPEQMADRMSAAHGAELTHPTHCCLSRFEKRVFSGVGPRASQQAGPI